MQPSDRRLPRGSNSRSFFGAVGIAGLLAILGFIGLAAGAPVGHATRPATSDEFVNVTATTNFAFDPGQFTVSPGATVHLTLTQTSTTNHTFVLSPVANFSFSGTNTTPDLVKFFRAHTPLVNLSLPGTVGASVRATFTAPAAGTYEYVCVIKDHFAGGMHGIMTSGTPSSGGGGSSSTTLYIVVGVVVLVIVLVAAAVMMRRRPKPPAA